MVGRMSTRRHADRMGVRRTGAGRPRKIPRTSTRPVTEDIVGAASRLFARQGVAATTMAEIAEASGLQVSSLYYYFRSKEEVLEQILAEVNRVPLELLEQARSDHPDAATRLHAFVRHDAAALCRFPFDINEIHRLAGASEGDYTRYWTERTELAAGVEQIVRDGMAEGSLIDIDPQLTALTLLANDEATQNWYRPSSETARPDTASPDPDTVGVFLADLVLRGLLRRPADLTAIAAATAPGQ